MKILLVSERLSSVDDEGIRNMAVALLEHLSRGHRVLALTSWQGEVHPRAKPVAMNRWFLNQALWIQVRRFSPDAVLYVPWTSGSPRTFFRCRILRLAAAAPVAVLLSQPYAYSAWHRPVVRALLPDLVMAMTESVVAQFSRFGIPAHLVPAGVDLDRFRILPPERRQEIRRGLGVSPQHCLILHVGHLNTHRLDVDELLTLVDHPQRRLVLVGSSSTPHDSHLVARLKQRGCIVIGEFLPRIEELYGAADCYLFPTREPRSSIGVPLSVLEALACGIPVVSRPFQALPRLFPDTPFVQFFASRDEMEVALASLPRSCSPRARELVRGLDWRSVGGQVEALLAIMSNK